MSADEALLARLALTGQYDADGVHRGARVETCPGCRHHILVGLDGDRCAVVARADCHEIDHLGEFLALRLGLCTYSLAYGYNSEGKKRWILDPRMVCQIEARRRSAVVAAHRCGISIPPAKEPFLSGRPVPPRWTLAPGSPPPF